MTTEHLSECGEGVLDVLRNALALARGRRLAFVQLLYSDSSSDLISLPPPADKDPTPCAKAPTSTTRTEQAILAVLSRAEKPLKASAIAGRARARNLDLNCGSHLRRVLAEMVRVGRIRRAIVDGNAGYILSPKACPEPANEDEHEHKDRQGKLSNAELADRIAAARTAKANGHAVNLD